MPKQCFVIGPIGEAGSQTRAAADAFMKYIVEPTLASFDYSAPVLRADTLGEPGRITSQIIKLLMDADLVIADLTANNPNVFYELSLRHALGKPAIHMAADGTILPFDLHDNRTIFYTMDIRDVNAACAELARQIGVVRAAGYKANNPITETLGAIELSTSHDPIRQALASILSRLEGLEASTADMRRTQSLAHFADAAGLRGVLTGALTSHRVPYVDMFADTPLAAAIADKAAAIADKAAEPAEAEKAVKPKDKG